MDKFIVWKKMGDIEQEQYIRTKIKSNKYKLIYITETYLSGEDVKELERAIPNKFGDDGENSINFERSEAHNIVKISK